MPRFLVESEFFSPSQSQANEESIVPRRREAPLRNFSRPLACLSPDGRTVYSLEIDENSAFIQAHNLPLEGCTDEEIEREFPAVIRTKLPPNVTATLKIDSPVELFCADGDSMPRPPRDTESPQQCLLPLLCLYTRHSVFLLQLAFQCPFDSDNVVPGEVLSVTEPFESHLVSESSSASIVRVRPAPQRRMGYATMCPPGSMAMLTRDPVGNEFALVLYHGPHDSRPKGWTSVPLRFGMEQLVDDDENTITDFCFGQSNGQPLLATMSVLLLKASGDVLGASPILFDGAVVAKSLVRDSKEYLQYVHGTQTNEARGRQCFAALRFFHDAFGPDNENPYVTARTSLGAAIESSLMWPVQIQGPVLVSPVSEPDEELNRALVIEPFYARDLVGMAIGRERTAVDFAVVPCTSLLPRFTYMDDHDHYDVDNMIAGLGDVVERVVVDSGEDEGRDSGLATLVHDPIVNNMIHYASARGVVSITTNALNIYSNKVREEADGAGFASPSGSRNEEVVRSMAWSSLDVSAGDDRISLAGAVVSGDALLGHTLVVSLSNGSPAAVNLTESRYLHEAESLFQTEANEEEEKNSVANEALKAMESTPPLHELLAPLIKQVNTGLSGMGKIVGGRTEQKDINPATLCTAIAVKERCEKEIVLPLKEMDQLAAARLKELKRMYKSQLQQITALKDTIQLLKDRMKATSENMEVAESNSTLLAQRSASLLQASQDLRPTLTDAEIDYFRLLQTTKAKFDKWEEPIGAVQKDSTELCDAMNAGRATAELDFTSAEAKQCYALLDGEEQSLDRSNMSLDQTRRVLNSVVSATGLGAADENISPPNAIDQQ